MKLYFFKYGYRKYPGIDVVFKNSQFRIGGGQIAFWRGDAPVFNILF